MNRKEIENLIRTLGDSDCRVRERAMESLRKIDDGRVVKRLISTVVDNRESENVLQRASDVLVEMGDAYVVETLTKALGRTDSAVQKNIIEVLNKIFPQITEIIFGEIPSNNIRTFVRNLETSLLTIPMSGLRKVHIDAEMYDFDMVERFITYAINYVGQKHLRKKVEVYIYGNPDKLHQNLLNSLNNLCRKVITIGKNTV